MKIQYEEPLASLFGSEQSNGRDYSVLIREKVAALMLAVDGDNDKLIKAAAFDICVLVSAVRHSFFESLDSLWRMEMLVKHFDKQTAFMGSYRLASESLDGAIRAFLLESDDREDFVRAATLAESAMNSVAQAVRDANAFCDEMA